MKRTDMKVPLGVGFCRRASVRSLRGDMAVACRRSISEHDSIDASEWRDMHGDFYWLGADANDSRITNFVSCNVE